MLFIKIYLISILIMGLILLIGSYRELKKLNFKELSLMFLTMPIVLLIHIVKQFFRK